MEFSTRPTRDTNLFFKIPGKSPAPPQTDSLKKPTLNVSPNEAPRALASPEPKSSMVARMLAVALTCFTSTGQTGQAPQLAPSAAPISPPPERTALKAVQSPSNKSDPKAKPPAAFANSAPAVSPPLGAPPDKAKIAPPTSHGLQIRRGLALPWPVHSQTTGTPSIASAARPTAATTKLSEAAKPLFEISPRAGAPALARDSVGHFQTVWPLLVASKHQGVDEYPMVAFPLTRNAPTTVEHTIFEPKLRRPPLPHDGEKWTKFITHVAYRNSNLLSLVVSIVMEIMQGYQSVNNWKGSPFGEQSGRVSLQFSRN